MAMMQKVILVFIRLRYLGSATILRHVVPIAIASVCMTVKALEVEVLHILFAVGGFSTSGEGR
jgi:hypothetical protein